MIARLKLENWEKKNSGRSWSSCSQWRCGKGWCSDSSNDFIFNGKVKNWRIHGDFGQTWRLDEDTVLSNLTLHRAGPGDKGFRHHHYHHLINIIQHQHHNHQQQYDDHLFIDDWRSINPWKSPSGNYTCSLPGELSSLGEHTVRVHILDYELPVAVHSGYILYSLRATRMKQSSGRWGHSGRGLWALGMVLTIADWWREVFWPSSPKPTRLWSAF